MSFDISKGERMNHELPAWTPVASMFLALLTATPSSGQPLRPRSDPSKGFNSSVATGRISKPATAVTDAVRVDPARPIFLLPQHGNANGGVDYGYNNVGVIFGARIYSGNLAMAIELFYYIPSNADNFYREGDYRASSGRIGRDTGTDNGAYYCPEGYAAVGLEGASGLAVDRVGLLCGQIGNLAKVVALPIFGGNGGNAFRNNCASTGSLGFLTGVRVRSGAWMDSIQGLCQAGPGGAPEPSTKAAPTKAKPAKPIDKLTEERAVSIAVGADRSEVLEKLGQPSLMIGGALERFEYQLESGGTLTVEFADGRVTKIERRGGH